MPPTTTGTVESRLLHARHHLLHQRQMAAGQDRQPDHVGAFPCAPRRRSPPASGGCPRRPRPCRHRARAPRSARRRWNGRRARACRPGTSGGGRACATPDRRRRGCRRARSTSLRMARPTPVGARYSPNASRSVQAPFAGGDAGFGAGDRGRHDVAAAGRRALADPSSAAATALLSRAARQALSRSIWSRSASADTVRIASVGAGERRGLGLEKRLTPTTICSPRSIASSRAVLDSTSCCFM